MPSEEFGRLSRTRRPPAQCFMHRSLVWENDLVLNFTFDKADRPAVYRQATNRVPIYDLGNHL